MRARVKTAIRYTWNAIAGDWMQAVGDADGSCDLESMIEGCIDADRVLAFGDDDEAAEALYALKSWEEMKALGREALKGYV
jgi:hypothetical protein